MRDPEGEPGGYIIEYVHVPASRSVKVTAIDPATGREAIIIAPAGADKDGLAKLAIRKLRYVLKRK